MSNFVWASSIAELQAIDPLDAVGDGSDVALAAGDKAVLISSNMLCLMYLRNSAGAVNDSYRVVVPSVNPGDFWWECQAVFGEEVTAIPSGTLSTLPVGVERALPGWTLGSRLLYSDDYDYTHLDLNSLCTSSGFYYGAITVIRNNHLYGISGYDSFKINLTTGQVTKVPNWYLGSSTKRHERVLYDPSFGPYLYTMFGTGVLGGTYLETYNLDTGASSQKVVSSVNDLFYMTWTYQLTQIMWDGKLYFFGGDEILGGTNVGNYAQAYDIANDTWDDLAVLPWDDRILNYAVDRTNGYLYVLSTNIVGTPNFYRYNFSTNMWTGPLANPSSPIGYNQKGVFVDATTIKFTSYQAGWKVWTYDTVGDSWSVETSTNTLRNYEQPFVYEGSEYFAKYGSASQKALFMRQPFEMPYRMTKD